MAEAHLATPEERYTSPKSMPSLCSEAGDVCSSILRQRWRSGWGKHVSGEGGREAGSAEGLDTVLGRHEAAGLHGLGLFRLRRCMRAQLCWSSTPRHAPVGGVVARPDPVHAGDGGEVGDEGLQRGVGTERGWRSGVRGNLVERKAFYSTCVLPVSSGFAARPGERSSCLPTHPPTNHHSPGHAPAPAHLRLEAQGAKVDAHAAGLEHQQLVKGLKDVDRRLVDGAHHCGAMGEEHSGGDE